MPVLGVSLHSLVFTCNEFFFVYSSYTPPLGLFSLIREESTLRFGFSDLALSWHAHSRGIISSATGAEMEGVLVKLEGLGRAELERVG